MKALNVATITSQEQYRSLSRLAFKGGTWLAFFKTCSQILSWTTTIIVARILVPSDYGLMELATIIAGYTMKFSEFGLGAAIIQRPKTDQNELSSVFWFSVCVSVLFALSCFGLAYITGWVFNEPRVIPLTKAVSILFLIQGLQVVPSNILRRNLQFKTVGLIEIVSVVLSCGSMIFIANMGGGAWTLIGGLICLGMIQMVLSFYACKWRPRKHFNFGEAKGYLSFGIIIVLQGSLFYVYEKSDKFFAGRAWSSSVLGFYSFALQLAQIPTEKITVLINMVAFSALSKLQNNKNEFNRFYLNIIKITATFVLPLFAGGYLVGDDLIRILLGEKWFPIITVFKFLCLGQILVSINTVNGFVHNSQGRPQWTLFYHLGCAMLLSISFYYAVKGGLEAILIPWFTTYVVIASIWIIITLRKIGIGVLSYLRNLMNPVLGTILMALAVIVYSSSLISLEIQMDLFFKIICKIGIGAIVYIGYLWVFDRKLIYAFRDLR